MPTTNRKRILMGEDIFSKEKQAKPTICFYGFRCYVFSPSFVERSGWNTEEGFDVYIIETRKPKDNPSERTEIIICFEKIENNIFKLIKQFNLNGSDSSYCRLIISYFAVRWAKKYKKEVRGCPWRDVISYIK